MPDNGATTAQHSVAHDPSAEAHSGRGVLHRFYSWLDRLCGDCEDIPRYGSYARESFYRDLLVQPEYGLLAGVVSIMVKKATSWQWQLAGGSPEMRDFLLDTVTTRAQFGRGYPSLMSLCASEFYTQDKGLFFEIYDLTFPDETVDKRGPLRPPALGIIHLDSALCDLTRDPVWPVLYNNPATGKRHILHSSRVVHIVDMPNPDYGLAGWGQCATGRAIQRAQIIARQGELESERMDNMPPSGAAILDNVHVATTEEQYQTRLDELGLRTYRPILLLENIDPERKADIRFVEFSSLPDGYDPQREFTLAMLAFALAFGEDVRTFTALSEGKLGTASEAEVKRDVARAITAAYLRAQWSSAMTNKVFAGTDVRWEWIAQDEAQERQRAETMSVQAETINNLFVNGLYTKEQAQRAMIEVGLLDEQALLADQLDPGTTEASGSERAHSELNTNDGCDCCACRQAVAPPADRIVESEIERRTNEYQAEIDDIYVGWIDETRRALEATDPDEWAALIVAAVASLIATMIELGRARIDQSFTDGLDGFEATPLGVRDLDEVIIRNDNLLESSFGFDLQQDLLRNAVEGDVELVVSRMEAKRARMNTYAGPFYRVFWYGVGDRHRQLAVAPRILRELDSAAAHCPDCPPKARIYESYTVMVAVVGVPGDTSNQCGCNCRCRLLQETSPNSDEWELF